MLQVGASPELPQEPRERLNARPTLAAHPARPGPCARIRPPSARRRSSTLETSFICISRAGSLSGEGPLRRSEGIALAMSFRPAGCSECTSRDDRMLSDVGGALAHGESNGRPPHSPERARQDFLSEAATPTVGTSPTGQDGPQRASTPLPVRNARPEQERRWPRRDSELLPLFTRTSCGDGV